MNLSSENYVHTHGKMKIIDDFTNCESDIRIDNKVAVVTGSTSGIGVEIAKNLARRGAKVVLASRSLEKLEQTKDEIKNATGSSNVVGRQLDFESLDSVRKFVHEMYMFEPRVDILINNIGAIGLEDKLTQDNLHLMMQVNYFGTFLLTFLMFPLLKASSPSRIISITSSSLLLGYVDFDHWNEVGKYSSLGYYCNAKLADVLFTVEMNKRIQGSGVNVFSMDPGLARTDFLRNFKNLNPLIRNGLFIVGRPLDRVATMPVFMAIDPRVANSSGKHFRDCSEFYSSWFADDAKLTERLWIESKKLVKITSDEDWENV